MNSKMVAGTRYIVDAALIKKLSLLTSKAIICFSTFFIKRNDCSDVSKRVLQDEGTLNVHYFNTSSHAVCWDNSYQLRY